MKVLFLILVTFNVMADCDSKYRKCEIALSMSELAGRNVDYSICSDNRLKCEATELRIEDMEKDATAFYMGEEK